jgi:hypothetical protein
MEGRRLPIWRRVPPTRGTKTSTSRAAKEIPRSIRPTKVTSRTGDRCRPAIKLRPRIARMAVRAAASRTRPNPLHSSEPDRLRGRRPTPATAVSRAVGVSATATIPTTRPRRGRGRQSPPDAETEKRPRPVIARSRSELSRAGLTPPPKLDVIAGTIRRANAMPSKAAGTTPTQRDRHIEVIAERGRLGWQKASGTTSTSAQGL